MRLAGGVTYTRDEQSFAESIRKTLPADHAHALGSQEKIVPPTEGYTSASTDAGDVSWMLPTAALTTATFVPGVPAHSWQATACAGSSIGRKGMVVAAKSLVLTAVDLYTDPANIQAAKASFEQRRAGYEYKSRIPTDRKPTLNYRDSSH
jgi:aminobenzoyl-glutamate utilization protein B